MDKLVMKRLSDVFSLRYDTETIGRSGASYEKKNDENPMVVPSSTVAVCIHKRATKESILMKQIYLKLSINGRKVEGPLLEAIINCVASSLVWNQLQYEVKIGEDEEGKLELECRIFNAIANDLRQMEKVQMLNLLILNFNYTTTEPQLFLKLFLCLLEYLLVSLLLNLEFKYPLVFSFHGRQLFQLHYPLIVKTIEELGNPAIEGPHFERNKNQVLYDNIMKLQRKILYEYNTLNILKECNNSKKRKRSCENYRHNSSKGASIKSMVYDLRFVDESAVELYLQKEKMSSITTLSLSS